MDLYSPQYVLYSYRLKGKKNCNLFNPRDSMLSNNIIYIHAIKIFMIKGYTNKN